jgi:hypothetical protein
MLCLVLLFLGIQEKRNLYNMLLGSANMHGSLSPCLFKPVLMWLNPWNVFILAWNIKQRGIEPGM